MSLSKIYHKLYDEWNIGFMVVNEDMLEQKTPTVNWLKHDYNDRWFADPQILSIKDGKIKVLVEEFLYSTDKGQIALLTVNADTYELIARKKILVLPTHLSFPQVRCLNGKVYIYPENGESGKLWQYEYDEEKDELTGSKTLLADTTLSDATIVPFDENIMLATSDFPNDNTLDIMRYSDSSKLYEKTETYRFKENVARNAGPCFRLGERWIRPAQVNNNSYGEALELQEIKVLENGDFNFHPICRWSSPHPTHKLSFHNFCVTEGLAAVDCRGYRFWFSPILERLISFIH